MQDDERVRHEYEFALAYERQSFEWFCKFRDADSASRWREARMLRDAASYELARRGLRL